MKPASIIGLIVPALILWWAYDSGGFERFMIIATIWLLFGQWVMAYYWDELRD